VVTICTASLTFSNSTFCPHSCIYVFCVDLRTNNDYFPIQHQLTGFYNRDAVCLLLGTDWIFICDSVQRQLVTVKEQYKTDFLKWLAEMQLQLTDQDPLPVAKTRCSRHWPPNTLAGNGNAGRWWMPRGYLAPSTSAHTHTHTHTNTPQFAPSHHWLLLHFL